jgi:hypothetical protein
MRQKKFTELTPWQKLVRKVAKEHPEFKSNRQRVEEAKRIWRETHPPVSIRKLRTDRDKYVPPLPPQGFEAVTPWEKHYFRIAQDYPELVTTRAKYKLARQLWMVERASDKDYEIFLEKNFHTL